MKTFICIVDQHLNVLTGKTKDHRKLIKKFNLADDKIRNREFVRVRILEKGDTYSIGLDDVDTLPDWFIENQNTIEEKCLYHMKKLENEKTVKIPDFT